MARLPELLPLLAVCVAAWAGLHGIARSQVRFRRAGDPLSPGRRRHLGLGLCCVSLGIALHHEGPAFGLILWTLSLSASAAVVAWSLGRPRA